MIWVDPAGNDTTAAAATQGNFSLPFATLGGAVSYLINNQLAGWSIVVHAGTYTEANTITLTPDCTNLTIFLEGSVNITKALSSPGNQDSLFILEDDTYVSIVGLVPDLGYTPDLSGPTAGASLISSNAGGLFVFKSTVGQRAMLELTNLSLIGISNYAQFLFGQAVTQEQFYLNMTNCYFQSTGGGKGFGVTALFTAELPQSTIFDFRDCYFLTDNASGTMIDLSNWDDAGLNIDLKARDCTFNVKTSVTNSNIVSGIILTDKNGSASGKFSFFWGGNMFWSGNWNSSVSGALYMWYDQTLGSLNPPILSTFGPCIGTNDTTANIDLYTTQIAIYGNTKLQEPNKFNRS